MQCKNCEINILKIKICLTIINKKKSDENKFYLIFADLKSYPCNKRTHRGEKNNAIFSELEKRHTNVSNEVLRRKAVEQTAEVMNEWVDELHADIKNAKMAVKASGREAKVANDKLDKVTSIACTRLELLKDIKLI